MPLRYYAGSDSCPDSRLQAGLLAYLAHTSQRSTSNHRHDPDIVLFAKPTCPMRFRLRLLPAGSPPCPAESSSFPADRQFASDCSPPRFATTQLSSATGTWLSPTWTFTMLCVRLHERTGRLALGPISDATPAIAPRAALPPLNLTTLRQSLPAMRRRAHIAQAFVQHALIIRSIPC